MLFNPDDPANLVVLPASKDMAKKMGGTIHLGKHAEEAVDRVKKSILKAIKRSKEDGDPLNSLTLGAIESEKQGLLDGTRVLNQVEKRGQK